MLGVATDVNIMCEKTCPLHYMFYGHGNKSGNPEGTHVNTEYMKTWAQDRTRDSKAAITRQLPTVPVSSDLVWEVIKS